MNIETKAVADGRLERGPFAIRLYGPVRSWMAALTFAFPVSVLILLCMLFAPSDCVPRE